MCYFYFHHITERSSGEHISSSAQHTISDTALAQGRSDRRMVQQFSPTTGRFFRGGGQNSRPTDWLIAKLLLPFGNGGSRWLC